MESRLPEDIEAPDISFLCWTTGVRADTFPDGRVACVYPFVRISRTQPLSWQGSSYAFVCANATDNFGGVVSAGEMKVIEMRPTITLTSPANGATFKTSETIQLTATHNAPGGPIQKVQFFDGTTLIGEDFTAPYTVDWLNASTGAHAVTAKAVTALGAEYPSSVANITVTAGEAKLHFIEVDHLSTPRLIEDYQQRAVWTWEQHEPFGANVPNENPEGLGIFQFPLRFTGTYADTETGLLYNLRRDLDTAIGRYVQSDPIGLKGGSLSTYVHVENNPLINVDPLGLAVWLCNRQVKWYLGGIGNHSYLWNDNTGECCGRDQGHDPLRNCTERGPGAGGDACVEITGSEGREDAIMNCCQKTANQGWFFPVKNDCHTSVDRCFREVGLPNPGVPGGRMGTCSSCWLSDAPPAPINYIAP